MSTVLVELDAAERDQIRDELREFQADFTIVETKRFDGDAVLHVLVTLSAISIPVLAKIVVERIRANRYVVVKKEGRKITVEGLGAEDVIKVLSELSGHD